MRRTPLIAGLLLLVAACSSDVDAEPGIDVIDVSGPLDASAIDFMRASIEEAAANDQVLAVLQINSPAVLDAEALTALEQILDSPPLPVSAWVGPAPAQANGGIGRMVLDMEHAAISAGSEMNLTPIVAGEEDGTSGQSMTAEESGLVLWPSIRQYLQDLDGVTFGTASGPVIVETLKPFEDGVTLKPVTFRQPGLATRFRRLRLRQRRPSSFSSWGSPLPPRVLCHRSRCGGRCGGHILLLAGWGIVTLPVKWWALALALFGWAMLTTAYQRGGVLVLTIVGAVMLQVAGTFYVEGSGQIDPRWYVVLPSVSAALFFFLLAMPTVQRARFSTRTIGRDGLIGERGIAVDGFDPVGVVEVKGARWRATAHREAGLVAGSEILVSGVDGMFLEVEPVTKPAKSILNPHFLPCCRASS